MVSQKQFISQNLKHKNGKIYYLNNYEINKNINYVDNNYYYNVSEIIDLLQSNNVQIKINQDSDNVLIKYIDNNVDNNLINQILYSSNNI